MCGIRDDRRIGAGIILVVLGVLFFMGGGAWWPLFILIPGLMMLGAAVGGGRIGAAVFSIPGMIVAGTGALFLAQAVTGYWESWAYAWTLYVAFVGLGIMLMGQRFEDPGLIGSGRLVVKIGAVLFALMAFFFEGIFTLTGMHGSLLPLVLIAVGAFLLLRDGFGTRFLAVLDSGDSSRKPKRKAKSKRGDDVLFTGPIVYGSRVPRSSAPVGMGEAEDARPLDKIV